MNIQKINPGNTLPNHSRVVRVVVRNPSGEVSLSYDWRDGNRWRWWSDVIMWQEV